MSQVSVRPIGAAALLLFSLSACASIVSDTDSTTYIGTEPEGARCELHGQDFVRVVEAPNSITLPAKAAPIVVACKKEGYRTTTAELDTSMDGWIVGNLVFGGLIGVVIDAARGAGQKYPPQLQITLTPARFNSTAARDAWFDARRDALEKKWDKVVDQLQYGCAHGNTSCEAAADRARAERKKALEDLELESADVSVAN